jgi:hypothetical protein
MPASCVSDAGGGSFPKMRCGNEISLPDALGRVYRKIKNSISVPSHSNAIFSLGPSLQALLENAFSPKPAFLKQGAGTRIKFLKLQQRPKLMWVVFPQAV